MSGYHVGRNTPGYSPESEPYHVGTWSDALASLQGEIQNGFDALPWDEYETDAERDAENEYLLALSELNTLQVAAPGIEGGEYSYLLPTSDSEWDLGCAYWVTPCTEDECAEGES